MKKIMNLLLVTCLMLMSATVALAADREKVFEGADIESVQRLAIAQPLYTPAAETSPTKETLVRILFDASRVSKKMVMSYDDLAFDVHRDYKLDIKVLDKRKAAKAFNDYVSKYADAYLLVTVANGSHQIFFFDVYKAGTDELLYRYETVGGTYEEDTERAFVSYAEQFYKHFDRAVEDEPKRRAQKAKEEKLAAEKAAKEEAKAKEKAAKEAAKAEAKAKK
ncbi:MAG: coenzyme F(420) biosynthesis enzyme [Selenomonadaceae bacterium]|nr:coenzyme F(420) biosynthesis enzyme [Selenomonadaceae bacterium]